MEHENCHFYNPETKECSEVDGVKRMIKWGIGIIIGVFISAFGYFAHNQDKTHDLMIEQTKNVTELNTIMLHRVLPYIEEREKRHDTENPLDRPGNDRDRPFTSRHNPIGGPR